MKLNCEKCSLNQKEGKLDTKNTDDKQETSGQQAQPQLHQCPYPHVKGLHIPPTSSNSDRIKKQEGNTCLSQEPHKHKDTSRMEGKEREADANRPYQRILKGHFITRRHDAPKCFLTKHKLQNTQSTLRQHFLDS